MHPFPQPALMGRSVTPEAEALIARMTTPPTSLRRYLINRLVRRVKDAGVWSKFDALHLTAAADSQAANLNWKSTSYTLSPGGSPAFTADRGYLGDGVAAYLDPGFTGGSFAANSFSAGVWLNVDGADGGYGVGAASGVQLRPNDGGFLKAFQGVGVHSVAVANGLGFSAITETAAGASGQILQKNAAQTTFAASGPGSIGAGYYLLATTVAAGFTASRIAAAFLGQGLTAVELTAVYDAFNEYLTAVGGA